MQKLRWLLLSGLLLAGCNKTSPDTIVGSWGLFAEYGGIAGANYFPLGTGPTYRYKADGTYTENVPNYQGLGTGTYRIIRTGLADGKDVLLRTYMLNGSLHTQQDSIFISGDTMMLSQPPQCCDMIDQERYLRLNL